MRLVAAKSLLARDGIRRNLIALVGGMRAVNRWSREKEIKEDGFKDIRGTMKFAVITDKGKWTEDAKKRLEYLLPGYYT